MTISRSDPFIVSIVPIASIGAVIFLPNNEVIYSFTKNGDVPATPKRVS
jgi:hypothetical protein